MGKTRLGINIDHVATVRNARGENYPSPLKAALLSEKYGADSITIHLREDRRHIIDQDLIEIKKKGSKHIYKYTNATVFLDYVGDDNFYNLLNDGVIRYDNRLGIYRSGDKKGLLHNHGGGFRANPKNLDKLYSTKIEV